MEHAVLDQKSNVKKLELDTTWSTAYELPGFGNMMGKGPDAVGVFIRQGSRILSQIELALNEFIDRPIEELSILDFGCGVGRVALPFFFKHRRPSVCADVDQQAIDYLLKVIPGANPTKIDYSPPTPFKDNSFDAVYAISVWTHLPSELQDSWLREMRRILKPQGVALISTSSYSALKSRRKSLPPWKDVTDDDLKKQGFIFKPAGATPGVTSTYGYAAHDSDWLRANWSRTFNIETIKGSAIEGVQDLNILRKM